MEKKIICHKNWIGHEINESLTYHADDPFDREVYCRKTHSIKEPTIKECSDCPYYGDLMQGHGHACIWEDVTDAVCDVKHEDRYKEYERVDRLIKQGILEPFADDLLAKVKNLPYDEDKWIYQQSKDRKSRYLLGTRGAKTLICCGVNPSFASPEDLDPTMKNVDAIAQKNGFDSYVMINLYPMRATDPNKMHKDMDEEIVMENLKHIESVLQSGDCEIWAAWGTLIEKRKYLSDCLRQIAELTDTYKCKWFTIGEKSKAGHPHHPLYLKQDSKRDDFDVKAYVEGLK